MPCTFVVSRGHGLCCDGSGLSLQAIEMIEKDQREAERRPITKITHKGEIEIESEEPAKTVEVPEVRLIQLVFPTFKVVSAIPGRRINDHVHLISPHDPLAARPINRPSKQTRLCRQHMLRDRTQKQMVLPTSQNQNSIPTNQRQGVGVVGFCAAVMTVFTGCTKHGREGRSWLCLFGISVQTPTEETSPNVADATFKRSAILSPGWLYDQP